MGLKDGDGNSLSPNVISPDNSRTVPNRVVRIQSDDTRDVVWTGVTRSVMWDFANGVSSWDRVDSSLGTGTSDPPGAPPNGTHWFGGDTTNDGTQRWSMALADTLDVPFTPGDVIRVPLNERGTACEFYFGESDTSPSNQYEVRIDLANGHELRMDVDGSMTSFYDAPFPMEQYDLDDEWVDLFIWWNPDTSRYDEPRASDDGTGDFLVALYTNDGQPIDMFYADVGDTTYTAGGIGFSMNADNEAYIGNPEVGSPGAFDNFRYQDREISANEVAAFNTADLYGWGSGRAAFRMSAPGEFPTPPSGHDFQIVRPGQSGYSTMFSVAGTGTTDQRYDLPNYPKEGERAKVEVYSDTDGNLQATNICASEASEDFGIRFENRYGDGTVRIVEWINDQGEVLWEYDASIGAGNWYHQVFDRSVGGAGDVDLWLEDESQATLTSKKRINIDSAIRDNVGVGLIGSDSGAKHVWSNFRLF